MNKGINLKDDKVKILPYIQDAQHFMEALGSDYEVALWIAELLMKLDDNGLLNEEKDDEWKYRK